MTRNLLKARLAAREKQVGCIVMLPSPEVAEIIGIAGADLVMIDHEHGPGGISDFVAQARSLQATRTQAMVRVPRAEFAYAQRILDAGCLSIVAPGINTREEGEAFVQACRYPPLGVRGAGGGIRAAKYGLNPEYYQPAGEDDLLIVGQIESAQAVENIDEICAVPGLDMLLIGPRDLSASMRLLSRFDDPQVWELVAHAASRIRSSGKYLASTLHPGKTCREMFDQGYDLILASKDVDFLLNGVKAMRLS